MPVSLTATRTAPESSSRALSVTRPPSVENLMALESRLRSTWRRRPRSAVTTRWSAEGSITSVCRRASSWARTVPAVPCDGLQVVSLGLREGVLRCRHRQEQIAEPDHTIEGRAELVRYVREELVLEFARLIELGVEAGQLPVLVLELGVLRLEALR